MLSTASPTVAHIKQVANTIKAQIGMWPLAEVGARDFIAQTDSAFRPGLRFVCKPRHRLVLVQILLDEAMDTYIVKVHTKMRGGLWDSKPAIDQDMVYCDDLATIIRSLPSKF